MQETKPVFLIKKYHAILRAAVIVEAVNFIISLTDGIVAGNAIGEEAFAAIGLLAPFFSIATFLSTIIYSGTVLNFSYQVGRFDKRRANEFFSQGLFMAFLFGILYALILFLAGFYLIPRISPSEAITQQLGEYFNYILLFFLMQPISTLLDSLLVADGGERLSVVANVSQILSNVGLSILLVGFWGIKGIAIASVLSRFLYIVIACAHFFSKKNNLKLVRHWSKTDFFLIIRGGIVKASTYAFEAILTFFINLFAIFLFDENTIVVLVVVERFLGLMTLFIGASMACQPLIGTLQGEQNTKGLRFLMNTALKNIIVLSAVLTVLVFAGASLIVKAFGISEEPVFEHAVMALRIVSCTLVLQAVLVLLFIYYIYINKQALAFVICLIKNLVSPVVISAVLALAMRSEIGLWIGLGAAPILAIIISVLIVLLKYGRSRFPFLIVDNPDQKIFIYAFFIDPEQAVKMAQTVEAVMKEHGASEKAAMRAGLLTEEVLMLILDKNRESKKTVRAECNLIIRPDGVRMILRDSGQVFDITDEDMDVGSLRQFIVANLMIQQEIKLFMVTTGYNRNEFFFQTE